MDSIEIWIKHGSIGIFSLGSGNGNYLYEPEFIGLEWLKARFSDPGLKGIIIRGSGRHFSAGADMQMLRELATDETMLFQKMSAGKELIKLIEATPLPVVAEITGACFGGGLEIALACHIRICSENALFAFPEVNHGIMPGLGGSVNLSRVVGPGKAAEIILSGDIIEAQKAEAILLVDHVVRGEKLGKYTIEYLDRLTRDRDIEVIRSIMKSIHNSFHMDRDEALVEETRMFCRLAARNLGD